MSSIVLPRRSLLVGGLSTLFAPAVVRAASLMPIKPIIEGVSVDPRHTIWLKAYTVTVTRLGSTWVIEWRDAAGQKCRDPIYWGDTA